MAVQSELVLRQGKEFPLTLVQARGLFIGASAAYPASIFAQSAFMLLRLRKRQEKPDVMNMLLDAADALDTIVAAANKKHGKKVFAQVTPEAVKRILAVEIELMHDLQNLHDFGLQNILNVYPKLFRKPEEYSQYVNQLITWAAK